MVFLRPGLLPRLSITAVYIAHGKKLVTIMSEADISSLTWSIKTLSATHEPLSVKVLDKNTVQLTFFRALWENLGMSNYVGNTNYRGTNLIDYLGTFKSAFGLDETKTDPIPILACVIGACALALAVGGIIATG